jgi:hypothetical protein
MELRDITTSLELSKRLKELEVKQDSIFYYQIYATGAIRIVKNKTYASECSAYTSEELLDMMPRRIENPKEAHDWHGIHIWEVGGTRIAVYRNLGNESEITPNNILARGEDDRLCNALAKLLIHLLENKLIDIPKDK